MEALIPASRHFESRSLVKGSVAKTSRPTPALREPNLRFDSHQNLEDLELSHESQARSRTDP